MPLCCRRPELQSRVRLARRMWRRRRCRPPARARNLTRCVRAHAPARPRARSCVRAKARLHAHARFRAGSFRTMVRTNAQFPKYVDMLTLTSYYT
eukprot:3316305-Pleurochrysis_carterae.AAC.1